VVLHPRIWPGSADHVIVWCGGQIVFARGLPYFVLDSCITTSLDDYVAIVFVSLDHKADLHTPDGGFGSGQLRNATRTLLSPSVCTGLDGIGHEHLHDFGHGH
jgi:hypothetical protein